jgi:hypothetical protein
MLLIIATVGWVAFDVWVSIVTAGSIPASEWWGIFIGGILLAIFTLIALLVDRREHTVEIDGLKRGQADHSREHLALAQGTLGVYDRLAALSNTNPNQPSNGIAEAAVYKIERLESQLADVTKIFWRPLRDDERQYLTEELRKIGKYSVRISPDAQTDCRELASSLYHIFKDAGWTLEQIPSGGITWESAGASGIAVLGKYPADNEPGSKVLKLLVPLVKGGLQFSASLENNDRADVLIIIGPKQARTSLP